jgi:hypothetical protein
MGGAGDRVVYKVSRLWALLFVDDIAFQADGFES